MCAGPHSKSHLWNHDPDTPRARHATESRPTPAEQRHFPTER